MHIVTTKYLKPTNTRGSRIKASCCGYTITIDMDYALSTDANHLAAAQKLLQSMGGYGGAIESSETATGYKFVFN